MPTPCNFFVENVIPSTWEGEVRESSIKGKPDWRRLIEPLPCGNGFVEQGHESDGATVMFMRSIPFLGFPKHKHPIASRRHDRRCEIAAWFKAIAKQFPRFSKERKFYMQRYKVLRKFADDEFYIDVGKGGTKWEQRKGYIGVRAGAFF